MAVDPILQCAACGAKLKLRAASLKFLKQVRCGKCQANIEIPQELKDGSPIPSTPILAKVVEPSTTSVVPVPTPAPVRVSVPAPAEVSAASAPVPVASATPAPAPVPVASATPAPAPVPVAPTAEPTSVAPVVPASATSIAPALVTSVPSAPSVALEEIAEAVELVAPVAPAVSALAAGDNALVARIAALEAKVCIQQELLEKTVLQVRRIIQLKVDSSTANLSALER